MDILIINILVAVACLVIGYLFGSIPNSIWIGKVFFHQDPRDYGSKNAGGTNAGRLWGKKVGFLIIILDMLKLLLPLWMCWLFLTYVPFNGQPLLASTAVYYGDSSVLSSYVIQWPVYWLTALGSVLGHIYPCFAQFRGGKGVSTFMGMAAFTSWGLGFVPSLLYFAILKWKKYVSLASILVPIIDTLCAWIWVILVATGVISGNWASFVMYGPTLNPNWLYATILTVTTIIVIVRHRSNIQRLRNGTERKIKWMK